FLLFKKDSLSVRYLHQKDKHLLGKWLSTPSVLEFYEGRDSPFNLAKVTRKFYNREDDVDRCIVNFDGLDIGYIQFYLVNDKTSMKFYEGRDSPFNLAKVTRKFYNREDDVDRCIVNFDGLDIGYIQFYLVNDKTSMIDDYNEGKVTYGMDQFIGETEYWNKGIGALMISAM